MLTKGLGLPKEGAKRLIAMSLKFYLLRKSHVISYHIQSYFHIHMLLWRPSQNWAVLAVSKTSNL